MEYDEDRELTRYVWNHFQHLMTDFELRCGLAIMGRAKAAACESPGLAERLRRTWGAADDPEVEEALGDDPEAFRRGVRERLLSAHGADVFINRCRSCSRVLRTPKARQCFWCGLAWHGSGP